MLLKRHFRSEPYYADLLELFHETLWQVREVALPTRAAIRLPQLPCHLQFQTELGQLMDLTSQPQPAAGPIDLDRFTPERYRQIVKHKTAFYSFYMPVVCGLIIAGRGSDTSREQALEILLEMGEYFQIQDDVLDCFSSADVIGKVGTDIEDNKCSWLVVQVRVGVSEGGVGVGLGGMCTSGSCCRRLRPWVGGVGW